MTKQQETKTWKLHRGILDTFILGIPAYKDGGTVEFTGTNREANAEARRLTAEAEPGISYTVMGIKDEK